MNFFLLINKLLFNRRALIFTFPYNVIHLFFKLFVALCLSVMCGVIYWHVRNGREQEYIWDRIGFYHAILTIMPIPLLLIEINDGKQIFINQTIINSALT